MNENINDYTNVLRMVCETFYNVDLKCACDETRGIYENNMFTFTVNDMNDFDYTISFYYHNYFKCDVNMRSPRNNFHVTITDIVYGDVLVNYYTHFDNVIKNDNYILDIIQYIIKFCDDTDY